MPLNIEEEARLIAQMPEANVSRSLFKGRARTWDLNPEQRVMALVVSNEKAIPCDCCGKKRKKGYSLCVLGLQARFSGATYFFEQLPYFVCSLACAAASIMQHYADYAKDKIKSARLMKKYQQKDAVRMHADEKDGWLDPLGVLHICGPLQHVALIMGLGLRSEDAAQKLGWIRLRNSQWESAEFLQKEATQAQLDRVFDWCEEHSQPYPGWLKKRSSHDRAHF